ncbi:hypothetical protein ABH991_008426 [Bradyrhizobium ottawaense]|uniref:Uncharacterized protein n=1 Tax=Bradyrhizobium ottawaense TaxID=931866 RepID=A0ABV4FJJ0_9BRAD
MGKRLCAPSPRLGLTRRGLSLRLRSNGALAAASSPHQAPGRRLAPPRSSVRRLRTPGSCAGGGVGSRSCFTEHAALLTDRDPRGWLWRLKKRQADAANDQPPSRMQSVGGEVASGPTKTVSEQSLRSMEDTEDRRSVPRSDQVTGMGLVKLRRSRKTGRSAASHAAAGWTDRLRILVCSSGRIAGPGRVAAAW